MHTLDKSIKHNRRIILSLLIVIAFLLVLSGFIRLQISNREQYVEQSINNSIRRISLNPVRGLIRDKNGKILVDTRAQFSAAIIPGNVQSEGLDYVCNILNINKSEVKKKMRTSPRYRPLIIARDISDQQLIAIEENKHDLPGILAIEEPKRFYEKKIKSPHIFGSIGEVNKAEQFVNPIYDSGDLVGKSGIEKKYDLELRGTKGVHFMRVDASGRDLGQYDQSRNILPEHGNDLYLHLDLRHQHVAESLMVDQRGALVALDVRDGGVIALASKPDYNPDLLSGKIDPQVWNTLLNDDGHPLYSRAIQSAYPPGSTYKIVAAIAALQEKIINPSWQVHCPGYFKLGRKTIRCWNEGGHGTVDLYGAIKNSCNVYFFQLGLKIGLDTWSKYSRMLGFGARTGIDIPNENDGLVPTTEFFNRVYGVNGWTKGNLANLAIGQGELLTTPLQLAQFAMILANEGVYFKPHLVNRMYSFANNSYFDFPAEDDYITGVDKDVYDIVREGMRQVMDGGTGWLGKVPGIEMGGKTGTAENPHGDPHAWFIGFAPYEFPEVAIAVIVENAGGGGAIAAPIARKFLEIYFFNKLIPRYVAKKDSADAAAQDSLIFPLNPDNINPIQVMLPGDDN